jgi:DnaJ homolog subfamily A member 2
MCDTCKGSGNVFKDKDKCKKCKGVKTVETKKVLELYIPRGSKEGDKIVLPGEGDQMPDQEPGDIIFELEEIPHKVFRRAGSDLAAELEVTLAEALTGFDRVVVKHLDGRGIQIKHPKGKILRPGQVLKVDGEGMPMKRSEGKGDLYLVVNVKFPEDGWVSDDASLSTLKDILPKPDPVITADVVDEVDFDADADLDDFGGNSGGGGAEWEDEDDEEGGPQCATQ